MTCFGSAGAARAMRAATSRGIGIRSWRRGRAELEAAKRYNGMRCIWAIEDNFVPHRIDITCDTARLILRGLLAEETARELVEWVEKNADRPVSDADFYGRGESAAFNRMLIRLCELGLTK